MSDFRQDGYYSSEMHTKSDAQLFREYVTCGADVAFTELVQRHTNLVYSAALRQVGSPEAAAEIAQNVFLGLARGAQALMPRLSEEASLAGWLCRSTRNLSLNFRRDEFRRQSRQRKVMEQLVTTSEDAPDWERLCGALDDAMSQLNEADYDLLVLRFYKSLDYRDVGVAMGLSDDAAQKRVSRALEKLRQVLSRRGVRTSAAALSLVIAANAVQAAPAGLTVTISSVALAGATSPSTIIAATKVIAMTTLQKSIFTATVALLAGAGIYKTRQASQWREQVESLQAAQAPFAVQNQQLLRERDGLKKLVAVQMASSQPSAGMNELLRLRGEVSRLRQSAQELAQLKAAAAATGNDPVIEATLKSWATLATRLRERLEQMPDKKIPELQLLTQKDWFDAIKNAKQLDTDTDFREALHQLRNSAKQAFGDIAMEAIKKYAQANSGALPGDWSQLKPFFDTPLEDATLARYSLLQTGRLADVPQNEYLVAEKAPPVDDQFDSIYEFQIQGTHSSSLSNPGDIVWDSLVQFANAHNGNLPGEVSQLIPYLTRPLDQAKVQEILGSIPSGVSTIQQLKAAGPK